MASSCGLQFHNRGRNVVKCNKRIHRTANCEWIETFHHSSHIVLPAILLTRECEMGKIYFNELEYGITSIQQCGICIVRRSAAGGWSLIGVLGSSVHAFAFRENSHFQLPMRLIMRKTWKTTHCRKVSIDCLSWEHSSAENYFAIIGMQEDNTNIDFHHWRVLPSPCGRNFHLHWGIYLVAAGAKANNHTLRAPMVCGALSINAWNSVAWIQNNLKASVELISNIRPDYVQEMCNELESMI